MPGTKIVYGNVQKIYLQKSMLNVQKMFLCYVADKSNDEMNRLIYATFGIKIFVSIY